MIWKPVRGYEKLYEVSSEGDVRGLKSGRVLIGDVHRKTGYRSVTICHGDGGQHSKLVHLLVADAFIGPCPEGYEVDHLDGVKLHNSMTNLEYVTRLENAQRAAARALYLRGSAVPGSKLTDDLVVALRGMYWSGEWSYSELSRAFGCARSTLRAIVERRWWKHV
jgi:HNH endonuclease/NUMOD4 motif